MQGWKSDIIALGQFWKQQHMPSIDLYWFAINSFSAFYIYVIKLFTNIMGIKKWHLCGSSWSFFKEAFVFGW